MQMVRLGWARFVRSMGQKAATRIVAQNQAFNEVAVLACPMLCIRFTLCKVWHLSAVRRRLYLESATQYIIASETTHETIAELNAFEVWLRNKEIDK